MNALKAVLLSFLFAFNALAEGPFNTTVQLTEMEATFAKAASVESMPNRVAIFMVEPDGITKQGIELAITSDARAMIVEARLVAGRSVPVYQRANGAYYFFGEPGEYEIGIYQFAVDVAYKTLIDDVFIGQKAPPIELPPPTGSFDDLKKIVAAKLSELNDPIVANNLGKAYAEVLAKADGKTREAIATELRAARVAVMMARPKLSLVIAWNTFIDVCDEELKRVAASAEDFRSGMAIVSTMLIGNGQAR